MLAHWAHEYTGVITGNAKMAKGSPKDRLRQIMEILVEYDLTRYDLAVRAWADSDPAVANRYDGVIRQRLEFVSSLFAELGFEGAELEMRTRLFVCFHSWESSAFPAMSKKARLELIPLRLELLTRKT